MDRREEHRRDRRDRNHNEAKRERGGEGAFVGTPQISSVAARMTGPIDCRGVAVGMNLQTVA
jgi:hypothetical protein